MFLHKKNKNTKNRQGLIDKLLRISCSYKAEENTDQRYGEIIVGPKNINLQHHFSSCITSSILSCYHSAQFLKTEFFALFPSDQHRPLNQSHHREKHPEAHQVLLDVAQSKIYGLMKETCYPRFLASDIYLTLTKRAGPPLWQEKVPLLCF